MRLSSSQLGLLPGVIASYYFRKSISAAVSTSNTSTYSSKTEGSTGCEILLSSVTMESAKKKERMLYAVTSVNTKGFQIAFTVRVRHL